MRLCISIVAKFSGRYPYMTDDLVGAAMIGLCQAVDWAPTRMYDNNITPYIYKTCENFVRDLLQRRLVVRIPRGQWPTMREERDKFQPLVQSIDGLKHDEEEHYDPYDQVTEIGIQKIEEQPVVYKDFMESLKLGTREHTVVQRLLEGYSQTEIAKELDMCDSGITAIRQGLQVKLRKALEAL